MANRLSNLKLEEFSLVVGNDVQPANQESVTTFYKVQEKQMPPSTDKPTLAKSIADAVRAAFAKGQMIRTSEYQSTSKETIDDGQPADPAAASGGGTTIVITDTVDKSAAAPAAAAPGPRVAKTEPDPAAFAAEVAKVLQPVADQIRAVDARLEKIEKEPVGSRAIKTQTTGMTVTDNSGAKFPEFAKFLREHAGLTAGQKLSKTTISTSGWSYGLTYQESGNFIDYIVDQSTLLKQCRTITMPDKKYPVDKIGLGGNVLVKGTAGTDPGDTVSISGPTQVLLDAEEILAIVSVGDDTLEDNIEGDAFLQHLLGMVARSAANELEQAAIHGDSAAPDAGILDRFDGWVKLAIAGGAHVIEAMLDDDRYWPGPNAVKASRMLKALPSKYRRDPTQLACVLSPDLYLDYNDELATKGYANAWASITGIQDVPVRGIRNVKVPMLKQDVSFTYAAVPYTDGTLVMITDLRNLLFGIHRQIRVEPFRQPRKRCTDYVLSMRCDAKIENGDGIAIYNHASVRP